MPPRSSAARLAQRLTRDAAALAAAVAPADIRRLHVHDLGTVAAGDRRHMVGAAVGTGHALAAALGHRDGQPAICCAVNLIVRECQAAELSDLAAQAVIESVVLHELAHTLVSAESTPDRACRLLDSLTTSGAPDYTAAAIAAAHDSRWAAALCVLGERALRYRPRTRHLLAGQLSDDLATYGHSLPALRAAVGLVDDGEPLRELLADPDLISRLPPAATIPDPRQTGLTSCDALAACMTTR